MRKILFVILSISLLFSCKQNENKIANLEKQIEELKQELDNVYTPGFGDIMGGIQRHHSKLWFSGNNKNWELAEFEIHEIKENFEDLEKYHECKNESKYIPMVEPVLQTLENSIKEKNLEQFNKNFTSLTNTCNSCHTVTNHEFIEIRVPILSSVSTSNQVF